MRVSSAKETTAHPKHADCHGQESDCRTAEAVEKDLRTMARKAGRQVRGFLDVADKDISGATHSVTTLIREKPVQSSALALGVGLLLGLLFRRSTADQKNVGHP